LSLSDAYTYGSAGRAIAGRFVAPRSATLNSIYFFVTGYGGTAANVTTINVEFRNDANGKPGTTVHASGTVDPGATAGWKALTGLSYAFTENTVYWPVIADADTNGVDYATVLRNIGAGQDVIRYVASQTTDGFATNGAVTSQLSTIVLACSDQRAYGQPLTAAPASTNNSTRRGFYLSTTGIPGDMRLYGLLYATASSITAVSGIEVWTHNSGPTGTPSATGTTRLLHIGFITNSICGYTLSAPYRLLGKTPARVVYTFSAASSTINRLQIGTGVDNNLRNARVGGGQWWWTQENTTPTPDDWSNDNQDEICQSSLILEDPWDAYDGTAIGRRHSDLGLTRTLLR
jgi:hypothetical protein